MSTFSGIGKRIKSLRSDRGWSQQELADKVSASHYGVTIRQQHIGNLEVSKGDKLPSVPVLAAIASVFGVSIEYILGIERPEKINPLDGMAHDDQVLVMLLADRIKNRSDHPLTHRRRVAEAMGGDIGERVEELLIAEYVGG